MKTFITIMAVLAAVVAGYFIGRTAGPITSPAPSEPTESLESLLPDDMVQDLRDEAQRAILIDIWEQVKASRLTTGFGADGENAVLPPGLPPFTLTPFIESPPAGAGWIGEAEFSGVDRVRAAKDEWVIVNFWASWCAPCIAEFPDMDAAERMLREEGVPVRIIALNFDNTKTDTPESARELLADLGISHVPSMIAADATQREAVLAAVGLEKTPPLPYNIIYAPGGKPIATFTGGRAEEGPHWSADSMMEFYRALPRLKIID